LSYNNNKNFFSEAMFGSINQHLQSWLLLAAFALCKCPTQPFFIFFEACSHHRDSVTIYLIEGKIYVQVAATGEKEPCPDSIAGAIHHQQVSELFFNVDVPTRK